jgi:hypothetical protein
MKQTVTIVDTYANLTNSTTIIPDGMIVKVSGSNDFKIGDGTHKFSELSSQMGGVLH